MTRFPPMLQGHYGRSAVCSMAVGLIGLASANVTLAMQGFDLGLLRWAATLAGYAAGSFLIYLGHCHSINPPPTTRGA